MSLFRRNRPPRCQHAWTRVLAYGPWVLMGDDMYGWGRGRLVRVECGTCLEVHVREAWQVDDLEITWGLPDSPVYLETLTDWLWPYGATEPRAA